MNRTYGLPEDGMTVSRNNLATLERRPDVLLDGIVGGILTNLAAHLLEPDQDFLVGKSTKPNKLCVGLD